jgi:hypothetical protein
MWSPRAKSDLLDLENRLAELESSVPDSAQRFHELRRELKEQVRKNLASWRWRMPDEEFERLSERLRRLSEAAKGLTAQIGRAKQLQSEVRQLEESSQKATGPELGPWLKRRCRDWSIALKHVGTNTDRAAELGPDDVVLDRTETEVRLHAQALDWLRKAEQVLAVLGSDLHAAGLKAELPELEQRLYREGASAEWLQQLRSLVQPLQPLANRVEDPPPELQTVSALLTALRGWSRQLGTLEREVEILEQQRHFAAVEWTTAQIQELVTQAERLRDQLVSQAKREHDQRLAELADQLDDLRQACGPQPALEQRLDELGGQPFDSYQLFRNWLSLLEKVRNSFLAIANNNTGALERRRDLLVRELSGRLDQVRKKPVSDDVKRQAEVTEHELRQVAEAEGAEELLVALRHRRDLEHQVAVLTQQAEEEIAQLSQQLKALQEQNRELQQLAGAAGLAVANLASRILELEGQEASLEEARKRATDLVAEMEGTRQAFVERCRALLAERILSIESTVGILRQAGHPFPLSALPALAPAAGPGEAVQALTDAMTLDGQILQAVKRSLRGVERRLKQAAAHLAGIPLTALGAEDRELAEQLREKIAADSRPRARGLERLGRVSQLVQDCDVLFVRLLQEETRARDRLETLRLQLRRLTERRLRRFCPELADRVTALVYGIPDQPRQWRAVHHQLDVAAALLARVEAQAQRLASQELDRALEVLQRQLRVADDPGSREAARVLLDEVEALGQDDLPPMNLHLRVLNAAALDVPGGRP